MENGEDPKESKKGGYPIAAISLWAGLVIILYVLASGPLLMLENKGFLSSRTENFLIDVYEPVDWAYEETPLHRPVGMYLHLWSTNFDRSGEQH